MSHSHLHFEHSGLFLLDDYGVLEDLEQLPNHKKHEYVSNDFSNMHTIIQIYRIHISCDQCDLASFGLVF